MPQIIKQLQEDHKKIIETLEMAEMWTIGSPEYRKSLLDHLAQEDYLLYPKMLACELTKKVAQSFSDEPNYLKKLNQCVFT